MCRTLSQAVGRMARGDHACLVYGSEEERREAVLRFLRAGLQAGEKVVHIAHDDRGHGLPDWLAADGLDVAAMLASGQLELRGAGKAYLAGGAFDPEAMVELLREDVAAARDEGFAGYRVAGEMEWALSSAANTQALLEYERRVDAVLHEGGATALCQYDQRRFDAATVHSAEEVHPLVLAEPDGNRLVVEPGAPGELVLRGEVDYASCDSLVRSLEAAAARRSGLRLDLRELSFIDVSGMRAMLAVAERLEADGGRLVLISPRPIVRRLLEMLEIDGALEVEEAT